VVERPARLGGGQGLGQPVEIRTGGGAQAGIGGDTAEMPDQGLDLGARGGGVEVPAICYCSNSTGSG
jgi:hypothetical protein